MLVVIDAQTERLRRELRRGERATGKFQKNTSRHLKKLDSNFDRFQKRQAKRMKQFAAMYAGYAVTRGIGRVFSSIVTSSADLQASMNRLEAMAGATGLELARLRKEALRLGSSTQYTAGQVADGMNELAAAGMKTTKILGSIHSALMLSTAAQIDMAQASDIVTNIMSGFGHDTNRLAKDIDTLTATFIGSNTVLTELGEAFKQVGGLAANNQISFEETAAVFGLMANAGIKGEMAGTAFRNAILRLVAPPSEARKAIRELGLEVFDLNGKMRKFSDIIRDLEPHLKNQTALKDLFGLRSLTPMISLIKRGGDAIDDFSKRVDKAEDLTKKIAAVRMKGFYGSVKEMVSGFEALSITISDNLGLLEKLTYYFKTAAKGFRFFSREWSDVDIGTLSTVKEVDEAMAFVKEQKKHPSWWDNFLNRDTNEYAKKALADLRHRRVLLVHEDAMKFYNDIEKVLNAEATRQGQKKASALEELSTPGFWSAKVTKNPIHNDLIDIDREIAAMNLQRQTMGQSAGAVARLNTSREIYNQLQDRGVALTDADTMALERQLDKLRDAVNANAEYEKAMQNLQAVSDSVASSMEDAFAEFTRTGKLDFESMISSMLANLAQLAFQMSVIQPLFGGGSSGGGGLFGSILGSLTGIPGRASGGPVSAGKLYEVNEGRKMEMFVPSVNGTILSASNTQKAISGGGGAINVSIGDIVVEGGGGNPEEVANIVLAQVPAVVVQTVAQARAEGKL